MTFNEYSQFGNEIEITGVGLDLSEGISICVEQGSSIASFFQCGSFTGYCRQDIKKLPNVISIRKGGNKLYAISKTSNNLYKTSGTKNDCYPNEKILNANEYGLYERETNTGWRFKNRLNDLYICYSINGNSVDCEALANKTLPNGTYFKKNALTQEVEKIVIGFPKPINVKTGKVGNTNEGIIDEYKKKVLENKQTITLIVVAVILIAAILLIRK